MKTINTTELKSILDQHRLWVETNRVQGARADLTYADLTCAYLTYAELTYANLKGAYLTGADLTGANLEDASLTGANLTGALLTRANLWNASLRDANLHGANLHGANLTGANLTGAIGLPDISWIIPGCLAQLNKINLGFWLEKEGKRDNFIQDSIGFFIQNNPEEGTFDMLLGVRIIRGIPNWVKYSGLKKAS